MSKKVWWLLPLICLIAGGLAASLLCYFGQMRFDEAIREGIAVTLTMAVTLVQLFWIIRAYPTTVGLSVYAFFTGLGVGVTGTWIHILMEDIMSVALPPKLSVLRYLYYPSLLVFSCVMLALKRQLAETEQRYALQQDAAALLKEAELFKLRQQLQPHFLYNSLNAISSLIIIAPDKAGEMIGRLADFLRTSIKQGRAEIVTLKEELDYLRQYLWIESVRFGDRLQIEWLGDAAPETHIPPFLLQPIMENAIRHAIYGQTGAVSISILLESSAEALRITIRNPYDPAMKSRPGTGFGLDGIRRRLWLVYARQDLLQTSAEGHYFTTSILIPQ